MFNNYLDKIMSSSSGYLESILSEKELVRFYNVLKKLRPKDDKHCIELFDLHYRKLIKRKHQKEYKRTGSSLKKFINKKSENLKIIWGDCLDVLQKMDSESIQLMVTSPPYYNARDYSQWDDIGAYLSDMREIIRETYRVLDNHRVWVFNIGDIFDNPNTKTRSVWGKSRLPLGAYFINIFEEEGFTFIDDIIWDKGEVQSARNKSSSNPYPFYQYPINCYEHILIFHKHRLDLTRFPCPRCGTLKVNRNAQSEPGLQSWECKNNKCFERSASNRGKRFSLKTNLVQSDVVKNEDNSINKYTLKKWRRDIVPFGPVIKINLKGKNTLGHTAPFPEDIPDMAIRFFTFKGELVLDPFAGSFTAPKTAAKLGRIGIGIELNKNSFAGAIRKNLGNANQDLFENDIQFSEFSLK